MLRKTDLLIRIWFSQRSFKLKLVVGIATAALFLCGCVGLTTLLPEAADEALVTSAAPEGEQADVIRIIDGDTIEVRLADGQTRRLRYIGMDTPERGDAFSSEATEANRQLVEDQRVILVKDVSETDRYGRLLRYVYLLDGTFVNAELVRLGLAQVATFPPDVAHQETFLALQREAREAGIGLWAAPPVAAVPTNAAPLPTAVPTNPTPTSTAPSGPAPISDAAAAGDVQISFIFYDGVVEQVESDEYVEITNRGGAAVNLTGWRLNADDEGQDFWFPSFELQPGQSCRVYTNQVHPETCGFSFGSGRAIWSNRGECGHLFDAAGVEVSTYCWFW